MHAAVKQTFAAPLLASKNIGNGITDIKNACTQLLSKLVLPCFPLHWNSSCDLSKIKTGN